MVRLGIRAIRSCQVRELCGQVNDSSVAEQKAVVFPGADCAERTKKRGKCETKGRKTNGLLRKFEMENKQVS